MGEKKYLVGKKLEVATTKVVVDRCLQEKTRVVLKANQNLRVILLPNHQVVNKNLEIFLKGNDSRVEILGAILGQKDDDFRLEVKTVHQGLRTSAYTHVRGVLFDASRSFFSGLIRIEKGANKTSSLLENRTLILGERAKANSIPSLEIEADDVKASHAATVGRIDEQQLFYLRSRGLSRKTATRMVIDGFFEPILSKINDEKTVAQLKGDLWVDILKH